jgi:RND family efflux transporter MFP subunit
MNRPTSSRKLWYLLPVILVLVAGAAALHFHRLHQADASPPAERTPWALQTGTVERGSVAASLAASAVIESPNAIVLSPQIQGTVLAVGPRAGVAVRRGELLVRIDGRTVASNLSALEQQRKAAQADTDYAVKQQARLDAVLAEGGVSQSQADQARTAADGARAKTQSLADQISALRVQLGYAEIRAPQDAVVAQRLVEVGDTAAPGKPVYQLSAGQGAVAKVSLPADSLARVHVGDMLVLRQGDANLNLTISRVAPAVNAAGLGTVEADAATAPFGLPSGSTVAAEVRIRGAGETLTVPTAALVGSGNGAHVLVFTPGAKAGEAGHLHRVAVQVLTEGADRTAVQAALAPGDRIVVGQTAVLAQLRDGDAAVTANPTEAGQ